jgi:hypothetical protein
MSVRGFITSYLLLVVGFLMALAPYLVILAVLGSIDFIYFLILWPLTLYISLLTRKFSFIGLIIFFGAVLLATPPIPNYIAYDQGKGLVFRFIAVSEIIDWGFIVLIAIYAASMLIARYGLNNVLRKTVRNSQNGSMG